MWFLVCLLALDLNFLPVEASGMTQRGPSFLVEPPNKSEFSNSTGAIIPCSTDGRPLPAVTWVLQDGVTAVDVPGLRHTRHDGALVFPPFHGDEYRPDIHAAIYKCIVTNNVGTIGSRDVYVKAVVPQIYEIRLFDEYVEKGNMAVLRCPIPSFASDYVKVVAWERKDGFTITPDVFSGKYGMLENGDLYVRDVSEQDNSHSFRCQSENRITKEKKVSTNYSRIIATEPHHSHPPRLMRQSGRISAAVGTRTTLSCISQGYPVPTYRWHRKSREDLHRIPDIDNFVRQEDGVLVFRETIPSHSGKYVCLVSNSMGHQRVETELFVEEPLKTSIFPEEVRVDVGKSVAFNCSISGTEPTIRDIISWKKDMRTLFPSQNTRISFPVPSVLVVNRAQRNDGGMYQCFSRRDGESAQATSRLIIGDSEPKFRKTFTEKTVRPGSFVSLACVASGSPVPQVTWTLDNIWPLSTRPPGFVVGSYLMSDGGNADVVYSYVNVSSTDVADGGVYKCEAVNEAGSVFHEARLNVYGPLLVRPLNNLTALAGDLFSVLCPFGGFPFKDIRWRKDGRLLPLNQRQKIVSNGTLFIEELQSQVDDGKYSCEVSSGDQPSASTSFFLTIRTGPKVSSFLFKDDLHEGMRTAVTCIVAAGDPPFTVRWMKDGRTLNDGVLDVKILYGDDGIVSTLTITKLSYRHNGNYSCSATNDVATGSHSAILTVKVPPSWVLEPSDVSAIAGRPARIDCQASGVPQPHVRWKVATENPPEHFQTIVSSSNVHILVNGSLNFRNIETTDVGHYLCEANNGVGSGLSIVVRLTVHSAPHFQTRFVDKIVRRGELIEIEMNIKGDQPMSFYWRKNGALLDLENEPRYSQAIEDFQDGRRIKIVIEKAERRDSALFTGTSVNDFGDDSVNVQVTVQDIPDAPQNLEVHDVSSRTVRLTWNRPFDGNSPITHYTVAWRLPDGKLRTSSKTGQAGSNSPLTLPGNEESTLTVRKLKPLTRYFFRVKCQNALGESQYSAEMAVTTLDEPPTYAPKVLNVQPLSSKSINVTWQNLADDSLSGSIQGYYVGYKVRSSTLPYTFKPTQTADTSSHILYQVIYDLERFTDYSIVVQAFNSRGAGPPSEESTVRTLELDLPEPPVVKTFHVSSTTINISWDSRSSPYAPVTGYIIFYRTEGNGWQETHVTRDKTSYMLRGLKCGTSHYCYLLAFNSAGRGNGSEIITAKTEGNAPIAPEKRTLISVNSTSVRVFLNSWNDAGCPIQFFVVQYKMSGQREWTLVSNNIVPRQKNVTIMDLVPGTWYSLLMTATNDAGTTDAEYVFATLTLSGESPAPPSAVSDVGDSLYRHLTITVPVVSSGLVLVVVLFVVCFVSKRRTTSGCRPRTPDGADGSDATKPEQVALSVTYDSTQDPAYFPAPYATSRVQGYNMKHCMQSGHPEDIETFGSIRSGYGYGIAYPARRAEKQDGTYEAPVVYFQSYHQTEIEIRPHGEHVIYEVPDRGRKSHDSRSWREEGDGNSSTESDNEDFWRSIQSGNDRMAKEEARESETECDRLWKTLERSRYEGITR